MQTASGISKIFEHPESEHRFSGTLDQSHQTQRLIKYEPEKRLRKNLRRKRINKLESGQRFQQF